MKISESDSDSEPERLQYKVILLGDGAVGKTSIATRFTAESFTQSYKQTIGLDFFIKRVVLPGDIHVALQIWDIGGQSIGSKMLSSYIFGARAVVMCYDITSYDSFMNLEDWHRLVRKTFHNTHAEMPYLAVVGNKCDLSHMRAVRTEMVHRFADENDMYSFYMSAKSGDQVTACFYRIAAHLAGVPLMRPELEGATKVVTAAVVNHQRHDDDVHHGEVPDYTKGTRKGCVLS